MTRPIGIAANPASGKDIRRLVARASVFDNQEKRAIVARCLIGANAVGDAPIAYFDDMHHITRSVIEDGDIEAARIEGPGTGTALDTTRAAKKMRDLDCAVVITLGGDGTNRAFAKGWLEAPMIPLSTGTNNVFPRITEATIAGTAAALVAMEKVTFTDVADRAKVIHVVIDGEPDDIALIDAVVSSDRFIGARALLDSHLLKKSILTRANPAAVGVTAIGGLMHPLSSGEDAGLVLELSPGENQKCQVLNAPIAPGLFQEVRVQKLRRIDLGESVEVFGPCVLAFDGERERVLKNNQRAELTLHRDGPWVIDVERVMDAAARSGALLDSEQFMEVRDAV